MLTHAARIRWGWPAVIAIAACATTHPPGASQTSSSTSAAAVGEDAAGTIPGLAAPLEAAHFSAEAGLLAPMPVALTSFGAASDGQYLYVAGGYHGTPHRYSREGQVSDVRRLALTNNASDKEWQTIGQLSEGAQGLALIEYNGSVCRFGGSIADNTADQPTRMRSSNAAACLDVKSGAWKALPDLPKGLSSHAAARLGSSVYIAGGWTLSGETHGPFNESFLALDLSAPERGWQSLPAPAARRGIGVAASGERLVVVGGITPEGKQSREVAVYDTHTRAWQAGPEYPEDAFGAALAGAADGSVVASASGGRLFVWKPGQPSWQAAGTLAFPRFFHQLVTTADNAVVAVGGINGMHASARVRHVEKHELSAKGPQLTAWSMDRIGAAKNRQAVFVIDDYVYMFGGNNSLGQHDFSAENFVSEGLRIHLPSLVTQRLPAFPVAGQSMVIAQSGKRVFSLGGFGPGPKGALTQSEIYELDTTTLTWHKVAALPQGRTQFGVAAQADKLWILGGLNFDPAREGDAQFDHLLDVLGGPVDKLADTGARLRSPRRAFAGVTLNGQYYIVGGMRNDFALVDGCTRLDLANNTFADLACPEQTRLSGTLVALGDKLYLAGGSAKDKDNLEPSPDIDVFDPAASSWGRLAFKLPFNTRHAHVLTYGDQLLIVSTHNDEGRVRIALVDGLKNAPLEAAAPKSPAVAETKPKPDTTVLAKTKK